VRSAASAEAAGRLPTSSSSPSARDATARW
jgi:hypothetical protein